MSFFGVGNHGGGPTREMMERARRMADLDGVSPISVGTPEQFFEHVEAEIAAGAPVAETVEAFEALNSGELDHVTEQAFFNVGGVESVLEKSKQLQES